MSCKTIGPQSLMSSNEALPKWAIVVSVSYLCVDNIAVSDFTPLIIHPCHSLLQAGLHSFN